MFDPQFKNLADLFARDWVEWLAPSIGSPSIESVEPLNTDIPKKTIASDRAFRVGGPWPFVLHLEWEAGRSADRVVRALTYNVHYQLSTYLPVVTVFILCRPEANAADMTGRYEQRRMDGSPMMTWHYPVIRLWEISPDVFLTRPGIAPLVVLSSATVEELPTYVTRAEQLWESLESSTAGELQTAMAILMGLRYDKEVIDSLMKRSAVMKESTYYQAILRDGEAKGRVEGLVEGRVEGLIEGRVEGRVEGLIEGRVEGRVEGYGDHARRTLLRIGASRCGQPTSAIANQISGETDVDRLDRMIDRALTAADWDQIVAVR